MAETLLYLTELLGLPVYDLRRRKIGRVKDAAVVPVIDAARVDRFLIGAGYSWLSVRYDQVRSLSLRGIYLRDEQLTPYHSDEYMLRLERDLLDQQIIDSYGRKVVRVNDVTFDISPREGNDQLIVREVDIGVRSIVRRVFQGVLPPLWIRRMQQRIAPMSIGWEYCNIIEPDPQRRLRLNVSSAALQKMPAADLADIVEELGPSERETIIESLDTEAAAETLSEVDPDIQASILDSLETEKAAEIMEEMAPSEAAHALAELGEARAVAILQEMDAEDQREVSELLEYEEDTAGGMMNTEYLSLPQDASVGQAIALVRQNEELAESANTLFLTDAQERLRGAVPLGRLFLAPEESALEELRVENLVQVNLDDTQDRVTELFDKYNLLTLPVVDEEGRLNGAITADDVISRLRQR